MVTLYAECEVCRARFSGKDRSIKDMIEAARTHEEKPISGKDIPAGYIFIHGERYMVVEGLSRPTGEHVQRYAIAIINHHLMDALFPYIPESFGRENSFESDDVKLSRKVSDSEFASLKKRLEYLTNEDIRFMLKEKRGYIEDNGIQLAEGKLELTNKLAP